MKKTIFVLAVSMFVLTGLPLSSLAAGNNTPGVKKRQKKQQKRIFKGVKNGKITGKEFKVLQKQQARTQRLKVKAKSDGNVTFRERVRLHKRLNKNSKKIYRAKHNNRNQ